MTSLRTHSTILLAVVIAGGTACSQQQNSSQANSKAENASNELRHYYPLTQNRGWEYQVTVGDGRTARMVVKAFAQRNLQGKNVTPMETIISTKESGTGEEVGFSFVADDASGIYEFALQGPAEEPKIHASPKYYLKGPLQSGARWDSSDYGINLKCGISSVSDVLTLPAGTFDRVVTVKCAGIGTQQRAIIRVYETSWYAPDVGLIKSITQISQGNGVKQPADAKELLSFKR